MDRRGLRGLLLVKRPTTGSTGADGSYPEELGLAEMACKPFDGSATGMASARKMFRVDFLDKVPGDVLG